MATEYLGKEGTQELITKIQTTLVKSVEVRNVVIVDALPSNPDANTLYLIPEE